jgi:hypothetical protein
LIAAASIGFQYITNGSVETTQPSATSASNGGATSALTVAGLRLVPIGWGFFFGIIMNGLMNNRIQQQQQQIENNLGLPEPEPSSSPSPEPSYALRLDSLDMLFFNKRKVLKSCWA